MGYTPAREVGRLVRLATLACLVVAVLAALVGTLSGHPLAGALVGSGVVIGAANGHIARRLVDTGIPIFATSMARIMTLSTAAILIGFAAGFGRVWLVVLGVGIAQLLMAGSALREMSRS